MEKVRARIISGHSLFSGTAIVGIALENDRDCRALTALADKLGRTGRPASVEMARGNVGETSAYLRRKWLAWAEADAIDLEIAPDTVAMDAPF